MFHFSYSLIVGSLFFVFMALVVCIAQLNGPKPTMLASSVQSVAAYNATAPRVCTLVLFIYKAHVLLELLTLLTFGRFEVII